MTAIPTINDLTVRIDAELKRALAARGMMLYRMVSYQLGGEREEGRPGGGSWARNRGVACLLACHAAGGNPDIALPAAAAVELMYNCCQVHDDIQEGRGRLNGRDTVWRVWGTAQAINAGDGLHSLARFSMFRFRERGLASDVTSRAVRLLDEASLAMWEGRSEELEDRERLDTGVEDYLKTAGKKTGSLYSCAMRTGAVAASADDTAIDALGACGVALGVAVQVRDEARDFWSDAGWPSAYIGEISSIKWKPIPVVLALERAGREEKKRLYDTYLKPTLGPEDRAVIREAVEHSDTRRSCEELIHRYREEAKKALYAPGVSTDRAAALDGFMESLLEI